MECPCSISKMQAEFGADTQIRIDAKVQIIEAAKLSGNSMYQVQVMDLWVAVTEE